MVDAKAFLDQIMGQVNAWFRQAVPSGYDMSNAQNADPIARHNIFISNVRPKLSTELREYKFNLFNLLSNPLMPMPFKSSNACGAKNSSKQLFEFNAKNKSILPLAVDDESKALVADADRYSTTYAYLINNTILMKENKPERYALMSANLNQSYALLKADAKIKPLADRILGLSQMATGIDHMLNGRISDAKESFQASRGSLEAAKKGVIGNIDLGIMYQAIDKELLLQGSLDNMLRTVEMGSAGDPLATIASFEKIVSVSSELESTRTKWASTFKDESRIGEILDWVQMIKQAQKGMATINVLSGGGNVLYPFWLLDFPYTFKTGSLWMKKGVPVTEVMLVSAGFTTDDAILQSPAQALTDIFGNFEGSGVMDSITGKETTISNGESLKSLPRMISMQSAAGRRVIAPLSTKKEVTIFMEDYVASITRADSNVAKKLKLNAPQIKGLIFIPGELSQSGYTLNCDFGGVKPRNIGNMTRLSKAMV